MDEVKFAYICIDPCGCVMEVMVDNPAHKHDVEVAVRRMIKHGTLERVPIKDVGLCRSGLEHTKKGDCPHPQACPERALAPAAPETGGPGAR